jgi:Fe-S-cluster containining protein
MGTMECRPRCAACCIAPSISSPIPGMPDGKAADTRCIQLDGDDRCKIFGQPARPAVCASLRPSDEMCGSTREQALHWLRQVEQLTRPHIPIRV